jgi:hypothetical protein
VASAAEWRVILAAALLAGCVHAHAASGPRPNGATHDASVIAEWNASYDGRADLHVTGVVDSAVGGVFTIESGAEGFVEHLEARPDDARAAWERGSRDGRSFVLPACGKGRCQVRYDLRLREAARSLDDIDVGSEEGSAIEAPPSTWLLAPSGGDERALVRFRVVTTAQTAFRTGVFPSKTADGAWDIQLGDLWTSPYSVFGPLRVQTIDVPGGNARVELAITAGQLAVTDDELATWTKDATKAITTYFGRFPLPQALVIVVPSRGRWMGMGKTLSGGGGAIFVRVGERAKSSALHDDWVLVHEMVHLALPSVPREQHWAEEGLATYVEPFARVRAGLERPEEAWAGLVRGLPNGLPRAGDRGLDHTPTWGRTYWGGALFYLLADIEIRKRTNNAKGLEDALRGILARGGDNTRRWSLDFLFRMGDEAIGTPVLTELHTAMAASPYPVDLGEVFAKLGVVTTGDRVELDPQAPLAAIRRSIEGRQDR